MRQIDTTFAFASRLEEAQADISGNLKGFADGPPLSNKTGQLIGSGQIEAFRQFLNMDFEKQFHWMPK